MDYIYATDPFAGLVVLLLLGAIVYLFFRVTIGRKSFPLIEKKEEYIAAYDLYMLNKDLEKRGINFETLDAIIKRFNKKTSNQLDQVDNEYKNNEDETTKKRK